MEVTYSLAQEVSKLQTNCLDHKHQSLFLVDYFQIKNKQKYQLHRGVDGKYSIVVIFNYLKN